MTTLLSQVYVVGKKKIQGEKKEEGMLNYGKIVAGNYRNNRMHAELVLNEKQTLRLYISSLRYRQ